MLEDDNTQVSNESDLDSVLSDTYNNLQSEPDVEKTPSAAPTQELDQPDDAPEIETAPVQAAIQAPVSWSAAEKTLFATLPPEAQQVVAKRESDRDKFLTQKSNEYSQNLQQFTELDHAFNGMEQSLSTMGYTKAQAAKELVALYNHFDTDPAGYILQVAQSRGIDLQKLASGQLDPKQVALQQQTHKISTLEQKIQSFIKQQEEQSTSQLSSEIDRFSSEPGHEHFDAVRAHMGKLIETGEANDLQGAYDMAVWANPTTRAEMLKQQEEARIKESSNRANKAKQAAGPRLSSKELTNGKASGTDNIDDFLRDAYRNIQSA